ncbi:hypothetical protein KP509_04G066400 [Ceratopteris richardii]|nr:hypothetical protein KP509_04G066400 [Ceratopteris richardii]
MLQELLSEVLKVLVKLREDFILACGKEGSDSSNGTIEYACIVRSGVSTFMEIGKFAAVNGRDWVGMLNITWKGVIALLQTVNGKDIMSKLLDIHEIIRVIIGCTMESLNSAAESCDVLIQEKKDMNNISELKRLCIPVKFFLLNLIRVVTYFPWHAVDAFDDIIECGLHIILLRVEMSESSYMKSVAEAIVEIVEPNLFILLRTLFTSSEIKLQTKLQFLNDLIGIGNWNGSFSLSDMGKRKLDEIHSESTEICYGREANALLSRLLIYLSLLDCSHDFGAELLLELARRLDFPLQVICDSKIYAKLFELQVFATCGPPKLLWQYVYRALVKTLEMFFIALSGTEAWAEVEEFLYRNILHPHPLCRELILELWCFVSRHCEGCVVEVHIQDLVDVLNNMINLPFATLSEWPIRTITRLICSLVKSDPCHLACKVYELTFGMGSFAGDVKLGLSTALLREHFPIVVLDDDTRSLFISFAVKSITELWNEVKRNPMENLEKLSLVDKTLCSIFESLYQENFQHFCDAEKLYELTKVSVELLKLAHKSSVHKIRCQSLRYLSGVWKKIDPHQIRGIVQSLHSLIKGNKFPESVQRCIKICLAEVLSGFSEVSMPEDETDPFNCALWELYHLILRERHWAYAHLALASFGYFVAHTNWNDLWRFVPSDAALAYDAKSGTLANESIFMSTLRRFLERDAYNADNWNHKPTLEHEGKVLQKTLLKFDRVADRAHGVDAPDLVDTEHTDFESGVQIISTDSEISQAIRMLQDGMKLLRRKIPAWLKDTGRNLEQQHQIHDQLSLLDDVIGQLHVLQPP